MLESLSLALGIFWRNTVAKIVKTMPDTANRQKAMA